jgi:hypothetical protein
LVDARLEPTNDIAVGFEEGLVTDQLEGVQQCGSQNDIGQSDLIIYQIGLVHQILLQDLQGSTQINLRLGSSVDTKKDSKKKQQLECETNQPTKICLEPSFFVFVFQNAKSMVRLFALYLVSTYASALAGM